MKFTSRPTVSELTACVALLRPRLPPEFDARSLVDALETYRPGDSAAHLKTTAEKVRLLSVNETCEMLHLSRSTLYKLVRDGKLRPVRMSTHKLRFTEEAIGRMFEECQARSPSVHGSADACLQTAAIGEG